MPRRPRVLVEGGIYHVYNRFASGEGVFADPEEAKVEEYMTSTRSKNNRFADPALMLLPEQPAERERHQQVEAVVDQMPIDFAEALHPTGLL